MAPFTGNEVEVDYPYEGLAQNAYVISDAGAKHKTGMCFIFPACDICGALLVNQQLHDEFHDALEVGGDS